jgi:hypothetical protein
MRHRRRCYGRVIRRQEHIILVIIVLLLCTCHAKALKHASELKKHASGLKEHASGLKMRWPRGCELQDKTSAKASSEARHYQRARDQTQRAYRCPQKTPFPHGLQWRTRSSWAQLLRLPERGRGPLHAVLPPVDSGASQALALRAHLASLCQVCCLLAPGCSSHSKCSLRRTFLTCLWGTAEEATGICGPVFPSLPRSRPGGAPPFAALAPPARLSTHPCHLLHHSAGPVESARAHTHGNIISARAPSGTGKDDQALGEEAREQLQPLAHV